MRIKIASASSSASLLSSEADLKGPLAILLGNEGAGVPGDISRLSDIEVAVPMSGQAESLNVGIAASILLYEAQKQR